MRTSFFPRTKKLTFTRTGGMVVMISAGMFLRPGLLEQAQQAVTLRSAEPVQVVQTAQVESQPSAVVLPIAEYENRRTKKIFGQYVDDGRFLGYHTGEDIEYEDQAGEAPVMAIADGVVLFSGWASGYGGVIVVAHTISGQENINALYGHLDIDSAAVKVGDAVKQSQFLANLGDHDSHETDGRRKHLHFSLYKGEDLQFLGYIKNQDELGAWINPSDFFNAYGIIPK